MPFGIPSEDFHGGFGIKEKSIHTHPTESGTKTLNVTMICKAVYNSSIEVPVDMTLEEAIAYAKKHSEEIPTGEMEWIADVELDTENCDFESRHWYPVDTQIIK